MAKKSNKILNLHEFTQTMNKKFGVGTIQTLADDSSASILHWCSTGVLSLDEATGWGLPGGRIVEYFGPESSGKTTAAMAALVANQNQGGINIVVDAEGTFDQDRFMAMGGDPENCIMIDPGTMEEFYDKLKHVVDWAKSQEVPPTALVLIVVDSMPMVIPKAVLELEGDDVCVAAQARLNSAHLPTVNDRLGLNTCLLLLNQVRDKIGAMAWSQEGNIDTPGGRIIKHLCSIRVLFSKQGQIDNGKTGPQRMIIGQKTGGKVVKNKVAPPLRRVQFNIMFDERGVDIVKALLDDCVTNKWVTKGTKGGKYTLCHTNKEVEFTASEFAEVLSKRPKWQAAMLKACYTLPQTLPDLSRYVGKTVSDDEEKD